MDKRSWRDWLGEGDFGKRLFITFFAFIALALFLHFREVRTDTLDLGTTAERYIIGQVDFTFPDEEATLLLRQQAVRDVGTIYRLSEKELHDARLDFEQSLLTNPEWRDKLELITFDELYRGADEMEEALMGMRFTNARTLQKMRDFYLPVDDYFVLIPPKAGEAVRLPGKFWQEIQDKIFSSSHFNADAATFIRKAFESHVWALQQDSSAERAVRQVIQEKVPQQYTLVSAGAHIIDPGERVTPRHLAMLQTMKEAISKQRDPLAPRTIAGSLLLSFLFTAIGICYFRINYPSVLNSLQKMIIVLAIIFLTLAFAKTAEFLIVNKFPFLSDFFRYPILVPFATLLTYLLVSSEVALFITAFLAIIMGGTLAVNHGYFLMINLLAGWVTILFARNIHKRKEIFSALAKVWLVCIPVVVAFNLTQNIFSKPHLIQDITSSFIFLSIGALLVIVLLPMLESFFQVMTDMALMEYMDPNNELLRRLSVEAPGTYQHCLVVGSLAENAARTIHANGLFCRVATLYHDIGKLHNPHYFTENQLGGFNIHQLLTPLESAQVIIAHVPEGEHLARKHHLPQSFIDVIREHHGTTMVYYFYCKQLEQVGGDPTKVDERLFRYPGPKPHTKESAIIMLADTVEAASRSLDVISEETLRDMVETLVTEKIDDCQLDNCQLSFEELEQVKKSFVRTLVVTGHLRIKYPERKKSTAH